jgi:pyruvate dehydrogenase E2 component (dihydrolipoamide acetyltransferase)
VADHIDIVIPDLGDFEDVEVIEVLTSAGAAVSREDGLITLETDKASIDVPAPVSGEILEISIAVGDRVSSGDKIGRMAVEVGDTVLVTPAIEAEIMQGDTTVMSPPAAVPPGVAEKVTVSVPDIGDFTDVEVIEVHVAVGDEVDIEDPLLTLETDKAAMDVPSTARGTVQSVLVAVGDTVSEGSALVVVDAIAAASAENELVEKTVAIRNVPDTVATADASRQTVPQSSSQPAMQTRGLPAINEVGFSRAHASPSVRKLARELGVDLAQVKGSGAKSRVLHDDVKAFVKRILSGDIATPGAGLPKVPSVDFAKFGPVDLQPLTRIQKISGPRLQASWINLPHVTQHDLADITDLEARRQQLKGPAKERGISLTPLAFVLKACVAALKEYPKVNASLAEDGKSLVYKGYCHLGFAAETENGLMVPVIHDADKMDVYELATALAELSLAAREGKLKADQMQGASFTISSLGGIGGTAFTPIVNAPEVAILGVSRSTMQPVWSGSKFEPRLMLPLSFSYDHRVIDGAYAVRFTTFLGKALSNVDGLLQAIP